VRGLDGCAQEQTDPCDASGGDIVVGKDTEKGRAAAEQNRDDGGDSRSEQARVEPEKADRQPIDVIAR